MRAEAGTETFPNPLPRCRYEMLSLSAFLHGNGQIFELKCIISLLSSLTPSHRLDRPHENVPCGFLNLSVSKHFDLVSVFS